MIQYYSTRELAKRLGEVLDTTISYPTMRNWKRKEYIRPVGEFISGKLISPIYNDKTITKFISKLPEREKATTIRVRTYGSKTTDKA